jgi:lysophospholipase L1-like esterase
MSRSDRSWTIAPALLWFAGCLVVALVIDGGVGVLADRFTARRETGAPAGPGFSPVILADTRDLRPQTPDPVPDPEPGAQGKELLPTDRSQILALEDTCLDGTKEACKRWAMDAFFRKMHAAKQGKLGRALRVSWYGDSVIATDAIPSRFRASFQGEVGDGGPGFVYVVPPHRFCAHEAVARTSSGAWNTHAISVMQIPDGLYGVGGATVDTEDGRATIKLVAGTASSVELYYLEQPRGGTVRITADDKPLASVATRGAVKQAGHATATVDGGAKKFDVITTGRVRLFGIDLENPTGVVVDNFGVVSVNVKSFDANKAEHFGAELTHRGADLVMIMIGANEAQWLGPTDRDTRAYGAHYEKLLALVRGALPESSCLVISPLDQAEAKDGRFESRPVMQPLVKAQRAAAQAQGCAFYSTYDWMGGPGSAAKWHRKGWLGSDFQHLSNAGAKRFSDGLFGTLRLAYKTYAAAH